VRLKELIERLEALPADLIFERGFCDPHSWRGVYAELSFAPAENVSVASMLAAAREAVGKEYTGYKGGEYTMSPDTAVHLDHYGECSDDGDRIMELFGQVAPKGVVTAGAVSFDDLLKKEMQDPGFRKKFQWYYRQAAKPRKPVARCAYIQGDTLCRKKSADRWRVLAMAPQDSGMKAFMLVPLCKRHGEKRSKKAK